MTNFSGRTALIAPQRSGDPNKQHRSLATANCRCSVSPQRMMPIFGMLCLVTFTFTPWLPTVTAFSTACSISISRHYAEKDITVTRRSPFRLSMSPMDGDTNDDGTDDFSTMMASLHSRFKEIQDKETKIPLVVLDSMLPRQVLRVQVRNELMMDLVRDCLQREHPFFGMLGMARLRSGQQIHLTQGVEVEILKDELEFQQNDGGQGEKEGGMKLALRAGRRFQIEGEIENAGGGWTEARVTFLDSEQEERTEIENGKDPTVVARAISRARELTSPNMNMPNNLSLVDRWIELAKENERQEG
ncbi:ATP-dependent protease La LON substrate-binding domain containing protein [Nitzschia inconspicua]|uniref:ATP-dependent protease La LON substrate-binding domain containing protein n=1 Tax=Nitzschia inconspicua TaxID=303405 RepID=A0A9K3LUM5_9STRA|nr:ATP-dependent protease La LON substrate-binding domain containing protein [Nitzschia inconspicua]